MGDHQANGAIESVVRTLKAQMRATRFGLESRLGRQLAHDDPILMWIPTCGRHADSGKVPMARRLGRERARQKVGQRFIGVR